MKILITGFDPFGGAAVNPAYEAVKQLPDVIKGAEIIKLEIPTVFKKEAAVLKEGIARYNPDVVLCVGQAGGRSGITVEKVAINLMEARIPDNDGGQPVNEPVCADGETAYFANVPVKAMVQNIAKHGIPARISYSAGTFVCNDIMYRLLYLIERDYHKMRGGFIHVPYLPEQVVDMADGMPSMSAEMIAQGIAYAVAAVIEHPDDIAMGMGETH